MPPVMLLLATKCPQVLADVLHQDDGILFPPQPYRAPDPMAAMRLGPLLLYLLPSSSSPSLLLSPSSSSSFMSSPTATDPAVHFLALAQFYVRTHLIRYHFLARKTDECAKNYKKLPIQRHKLFLGIFARFPSRKVVPN